MWLARVKRGQTKPRARRDWARYTAVLASSGRVKCGWRVVSVGDIRSQAATNRRFDPYQRRNWLASGLEQPKTAATTTHRLLKKSLIVASATHTPISAKLSLPPKASTIWLNCCVPKGSTSRRGHCTSAPSPYTSRH